MRYKVTNITTKSSADVPDFDEWLSQQDALLLSEFPECAGKTPSQVIQESMAVYSDPSRGFISSSSRVSDDGLSWTWETIWESKEAFKNSINKTNNIELDVAVVDKETGESVVDANGNVVWQKKETAGAYIRRMYNETYGAELTCETFEADI